MKELIINVRHWYDRVNGNHYASLEVEFNGDTYSREAEYTSNTNDQYLHDALVLVKPDGWVQNPNGCYPQVTIFCRENEIFWRVNVVEVSKRQLF